MFQVLLFGLIVTNCGLLHATIHLIVPTKNADIVSLLGISYPELQNNMIYQVNKFELFQNQTRIPNQQEVDQLLQELETWHQNLTNSHQHMKSVMLQITDLRTQVLLIPFLSWVSGGEKSSTWAIKEINQHRNKPFPIEEYPLLENNLAIYLDQYKQTYKDISQLAIDLMSQGHRASIDKHLRDFINQSSALAEIVETKFNKALKEAKAQSKKVSLTAHLNTMQAIDSAKSQAKLAKQWLSSGSSPLSSNWFLVCFNIIIASFQRH